ncbi:helix-turn-helix domain-containing protein [Heliorestis convoluta]|uniref:Transcriptional regulator XRE family n=1 Tax=Heliorestis convoluta TaxID=356322 RepID=A0A5Q2MXN6_9FIRM|nr:helix-turn-helix domain-containing protein [Heliorestis convoluta]QGG47408.1 Transcriptional regulator XRE family [Heliorestis convoluta]
MKNQFKGYENPFAKTMRLIMDEHPHSGEKTTQKALAKAIGIRPQTVSLYMDGKTQPTADSLYKIAQYFDVSVDYLLTGVSAENKEMHKQLGLSEGAVNLIKRAHKDDKAGSCSKVVPVLDDLLSNVEFYKFLDDLSYKIENLKKLAQLSSDEKEKLMPGLNVQGYWEWDLNNYVHEFIKKELAKKGIHFTES